MKKILITIICFLLSSCSYNSIGRLYRSGNLSGYEYVYVKPTTQRSIGFCNNGHVVATIMSPSDMIVGEFMSMGFVALNDFPDSTLVQKTIVVAYGEKSVKKSGDRYRAEIVIQGLSCTDYKLLIAVDEVGYGNDEIEAIRDAIDRCFRKIIENR